MSVEKEILEQYRYVAIVGLSSNPDKDSHIVGSYLKEHGYNVTPVNPKEKEVLGEKSYPDLQSIPHPVEVVDIFRRPEDVPAIVEEAVKVGARVVWMQEGIKNEEAARFARGAGLQVVMDRCMRKEHMRHFGGG